MESFVTSLLVLLLIGISIAEEEENVSIIAPGDTPENTPDEVAKRYQIYEMKPRVYARSSNNQFGGGTYNVDEQKLLLEAHNQFRQAVAPAASNMDELVWSVSLANLAQEWSDGCVYEHPKRRRYPAYNGVGQNLYIKYHEKSGRNPPSPVIQPVTLWNDEEVDYRYEAQSCNRGKICGHYTQVVWAGTTHVGCGMTFCKVAKTNSGVDFPNAWLVTCNYSPGGNFRGQKPYKDGLPCTECPNGFCKNGLCADCDPSEAGCVCNLECKNCGTVDRTACTCQCPDGFYGPTCNKSCKDKHRYCGSNPGWPKFWCNNSRFPFVDLYCPKMCGGCIASTSTPSC